MIGFSAHIENETVENGDFRNVLYTGNHLQLVLMSLPPHEEIGLETHHENDQFFRCEAGQGRCVIDGNEHNLSDGVAVIIPAGSQHNIINTSDTEDLKLYTLYAPPHHKDGIIHETKKIAESNEEEFDGMTTE
jgi:mannose-6-phosphate isomerase-like protein (cupin superfamily)